LYLQKSSNYFFPLNFSSFKQRFHASSTVYLAINLLYNFLLVFSIIFTCTYLNLDFQLLSIISIHFSLNFFTSNIFFAFILVAFLASFTLKSSYCPTFLVFRVSSYNQNVSSLFSCPFTLLFFISFILTLSKLYNLILTPLVNIKSTLSSH